MELSGKYKYAFAEKAAIEEYAEQCEKTATCVVKNYRLGEFVYDLYFERAGSKFAYEFKARDSFNKNRDLIEHKRKLAQEHDIHFRLVYVQVPKDKDIEIEGIEDTLELSFNDSIPSELDALSTHTSIDEVEDASLSVCKIKRGKLYVEGKSEVYVQLCYDSGKEGQCFSDSFPFEFKGYWSFDERGNLILDRLTDLKIDTSSVDK